MRAKAGDEYLREACEHYEATPTELFAAIAAVQKQLGGNNFKLILLEELYRGSTTPALSEKYGIPTRRVYGMVMDARHKMAGQLYRTRGVGYRQRIAEEFNQLSSVQEMSTKIKMRPDIAEFVLRRPELASLQLAKSAHKVALVKRYLDGESREQIAASEGYDIEQVGLIIVDVLLKIMDSSSNILRNYDAWCTQVGTTTPATIAAQYGITTEQYKAAVEETWRNGWLHDYGYAVYECWEGKKTPTEAAEYCTLCFEVLNERISLVLRNLTLCIAHMYPQTVATAMEMSSDFAAQRSVQSGSTVRS